jgi:hypothetical protein
MYMTVPWTCGPHYDRPLVMVAVQKLLLTLRNLCALWFHVTLNLLTGFGTQSAARLWVVWTPGVRCERVWRLLLFRSRASNMLPHPACWILCIKSFWLHLRRSAILSGLRMWMRLCLPMGTVRIKWLCGSILAWQSWWVPCWREMSSIILSLVLE